MAVLSVKQIFDGESASQDETATRETLAWRVEVDAQGTPPADVLNASAGGTSIPAIGEAVGSLTVRSKNVSRVTTHPRLFVVTADLSNESDAASSGGGGEKWNADLRISGVEITETVYHDKDGTKILNAAGQYFDPTIEETFYAEELVVSFDTNKVDQNTIRECRGKLNSDTVTLDVKGYRRSFEPRSLRLINATQHTGLLDATPIWSMEYVLRWRDKRTVPGQNLPVGGWERVVLNQGFSKKVDGKLQKDTGIATPARLNAAGDAFLADTDESVYLVFKTVKDTAFLPLFAGL